MAKRKWKHVQYWEVLVIREVKIKTTTREPFTPTKMAQMEKSSHPERWWERENLELSCTAGMHTELRVVFLRASLIVAEN